MKKDYYTQSKVETLVENIIRQMVHDRWYPDYVVGITRGGLFPATMISHYLKVRMETLKISLRDGKDDGCESNLWMAEDAFGHNGTKKNILVVDDINDSGSTLNWLIKDWPSGCHPNSEWENVWENNVRFAVLVNNLSSNFDKVTYTGTEINKKEDDVWIVFPWENWWEKR